MRSPEVELLQPRATRAKRSGQLLASGGCELAGIQPETQQLPALDAHGDATDRTVVEVIGMQLNERGWQRVDHMPHSHC
jgi:hypothetical protein